MLASSFSLRLYLTGLCPSWKHPERQEISAQLYWRLAKSCRVLELPLAVFAPFPSPAP